MKKFILWVVAVVAIVVVVDVVFGWASRYYISHSQLKGDYHSADHLIKDSIEELVVLGSSVSLNSLDTDMISDSLSIRAYNGGSNGQAFPYYLTFMEIIANKPGLKTVILGMDEATLYETGMGNRYNFLVPYYHTGHEGIDRRLESKSDLEKILLNSSLYRYNTIWFRILLYAFHDTRAGSATGFEAKPMPAYFPTKFTESETHEISKERANEFDEFVKLCSDRNINLIVCIPPRFQHLPDSTPGEKFLADRARSGKFELWFDARDPVFASDSTLFFDYLHVNGNGAKKYTETVISRLRKNESDK